MRAASRRYQQRAANHCPYGAETDLQHYRAGRTINRFGEEVETITKGRHDPCVGIRAVPIAEAMLAIVLMDHLLRQRAQNADVKTDIPRW